MNKLGIFMNFWEKNWDADHAKYIRKAKDIGFDVLEFQAQPLLEMSDDKIRSLNISNVAAVVIFEALRQQDYNDLSRYEPESLKGKDWLLK